MIDQCPKRTGAHARVWIEQQQEIRGGAARRFVDARGKSSVVVARDGDCPGVMCKRLRESRLVRLVIDNDDVGVRTVGIGGKRVEASGQLVVHLEVDDEHRDRLLKG